jgi:hypothetical protein
VIQTKVIDRGTRKEKMKRLWTWEKDRENKRWIGEQKGVSYMVLRYLLGRSNKGWGAVSERRMLNTVRRWKSEGEIKVISIEGEKWVTLTSKGYKKCELPYRYGVPYKDPPHNTGLNWIRLYIEYRQGETIEELISERELERQHPGKRRPDIVIISRGDTIAIHYERTFKGEEATIRQNNHYAGLYDYNWYFTEPKVHRRLAPLIADDPRFESITMQEVLAWLKKPERPSS